LKLIKISKLQRKSKNNKSKKANAKTFSFGGLFLLFKEEHKHFCLTFKKRRFVRKRPRGTKKILSVQKKTYLKYNFEVGVIQV